MSDSEMGAAIDAGRAVVAELVDRGADLIALGEMGIGNTTAASAIVAALVGAILEGAERHVVLVLDGFITGAAALVAARLAPAVAPRLIASHQSAERGHRVVLAELGLEPLLDLGLRLGEGSGAALAIPIVAASVRLLGEMATFDDAGVSERD